MNTINTQQLEKTGVWACLVLASIILIAALAMEFHVNPAVKLPVILGVVVMDAIVIFIGFSRKPAKI